jgi:UDP-3-O-[3-hydroxymyristoyl] glucosamine N-acyltransferase
MKGVVWTTGKLAEALGCELKGRADIELNRVAPLTEAGQNDLTFLANARYRDQLESCRAGAILIAPNESTPPDIARLESSQPYSLFRKALELFYPNTKFDAPIGIHPSAVIHPTAVIGSGVGIGPFVEIAPKTVIGDRTIIFGNSRIGRDSRVGADCRIGVNVSIRHEVTLGDRVVIGDGSVIGFDGFGYAPEVDGFHKIPQVGTVEIEDDVEIGANSCIDRATIGSTRIGKATKLDNLIQIAHGVHIGSNTVIAAQAGVSGSTDIGSGVMVGGQAGFVGHITVGDKMIIGAQAGVTKPVDIKGMVSGYPARPQMEAMRIEAAQGRLPELLRRVRELEQRLDKLTKS